MKALIAVLAAATAVLGMAPVAAADDVRAHGLTVQNGTFVDGYGREVVLRGFNVSGEVKLAENGFLPFASTADAQASAQAMKQLTGANAVRFLVSWAGAEPTRGQLDTTYLAKLTDQMRAFLDAGIEVCPTSTRTSTPATCSTRAAGTPATARRSG